PLQRGGERTCALVAAAGELAQDAILDKRARCRLIAAAAQQRGGGVLDAVDAKRTAAPGELVALAGKLGAKPRGEVLASVGAVALRADLTLTPQGIGWLAGCR